MEKMKMQSPNLTDKNIEKIAALFPNCITETADENGKLKKAINFEMLRAMLSDDIAEGDEAYEFTWVGKKAAIAEANRPIRKTLRPCPEESVNWDTTENLYIEGDNLEVLKLLQESYLGKVKMIYIDPPYNTGNDFIYRDDFAVSADEYAEESGQLDDDGNRLFKNTDSNGRFHSDWCSMIYSRLMLARNLLAEDGVIFISIDDHEVDNLKKICDEVFGGSCFVANMSWQRTYSIRNDSKGIPTETEHIIAYSKLPDWQPHALPRTDEMNSKYKNPDNDSSPWRTDNAFASDAATHQGMVYAIQHPLTGEMLYPSMNAHWRHQQDEILRIMNGWCKYELKELDDADKRAEICGVSPSEIKQGVKAIVLSESLDISSKKAREVYDKGPWPRYFFTKGGMGGIARKTYLDNVGGKLPTNFLPFSEVGHTDEAKKELIELFDGSAPFDTPKPVRLLERLLTIATDKDSIVMDFFSGSATTAHAVIKKNAADGGNRKFILVQIPEEIKSPEYNNLCEVGKERIRRAGVKIKQSLSEDGTDIRHIAKHLPDAEQMELIPGIAVPVIPPRWSTDESDERENKRMADELDIGFRVLKLDETNMEEVYYTPAETTQTMLAGFESNIKDDRTDLDLLFGCLLDWGLPLSMPYKSEQIEGVTVHTYNDGDLIACFDKNISESVIKTIAKRQPLRVVFRDDSFADSPSKINVSEIFKMISPDTRVKVI